MFNTKITEKKKRKKEKKKKERREKSFVLWHINHWRLFNTEFFLYIYDF